ncbi:putative RiPP precursor [Listeria sp. FSL L8-0308]|nr:MULTISPECIES: putative RiPP precursor [Paenibacillus]KAF6569854.1 putative RiPP precursor [Paenibacillus sp. EKM206P]KAF6585426.1 putative RiPP precursor [Paenibacillus sp. EKM205P]
MTNVVYSKPTIEIVAGFKESTKGLWFGEYVDVWGGKAPWHW